MQRQNDHWYELCFWRPSRSAYEVAGKGVFIGAVVGILAEVTGVIDYDDSCSYFGIAYVTALLCMLQGVIMHFSDQFEAPVRRAGS